MGKNNNNKSPLKQKPQQPSFFMMQRQKFGEDWLNRVNSEYIRKNALKIFRDLAYGAANIEVEWFETLPKNIADYSAAGSSAGASSVAAAKQASTPPLSTTA